MPDREGHCLGAVTMANEPEGRPGDRPSRGLGGSTYQTDFMPSDENPCSAARRRPARYSRFSTLTPKRV